MTVDPASARRILDANFNRAREALRVMEDYARFALDDGTLTAALKEARHALADEFRRLERRVDPCAEPMPAGTRGDLVASRDILGDVGTEITAPDEARRASASDVAVAAGKRLSEALRSIEEYGKTIDAGFAAQIERLRYHGYELERRLAITARAGERFGAVRLYVLITESLCSNGWFETAEAALRGGADAIQLREKTLRDVELLDRARRLAALCRERHAMLIVNDRPDIAVAAGAHGVHVGQDDLPIAAIRRIVPPSFVVGASTHTVNQVRAAAAMAPDYIAVGPMFNSPTKPQPHIAGPATLAQARGLTSLPLAAIGGISRANAASVLAAAPCCLCVCRDIVAQADAGAAARQFRDILDSQASAKSPPA
jgi:thiamine-phosphate pyrophosphorylase